MDQSAFVVETIHDTGRWDENGTPVLKKNRSHFDDLFGAVQSYNSYAILSSFLRIRLLILNPSSKRYDTLAVGDSDGDSLPILDYEALSSALKGCKTSQCTLEVF